MKNQMTLWQRMGRAVAKAAVSVTQIPLSALANDVGLWFNVIQESFPGAWQKNVTVESPKNLTSFSAVYACIDMISQDIAKLRPMLKQKKDGVWVDANRLSPFWRPLRKPNNYQTYLQFISYWVASKLMYGNAYILLERDDARRVSAMYVLDPRMVSVKVTPEGEVFYDIKRDNLSHKQDNDITVPATEIIHDRAVTLWHPLVGIPPLYACGISATQGLRIQNNSAIFFENMSRPSGMLTAPDTIEDETAKRLKTEFEKNFSGTNLGRLMVAGDGLKYEPFTMPPEQAQMIQQLQWTVQDVARSFKVPLYKLNTGDASKFQNYSSQNQDYYTQTLQALIESIELCLSEGLDVNNDTTIEYAVKLDVDNLLRMDPIGRADVNSKLVGAGIKAPNEARAEENLPPADGGDVPYLQQQNWPISLLRNRSPAELTPAKPAPAADPAPPKMLDVDENDKVIQELANGLISKLLNEELVV